MAAVDVDVNVHETAADPQLEVVRGLVARALSRARTSAATEDSRARSLGFVRALAEQLRDLVTGDDAVVLCRADDRERARMGMNELLYDVTACRVAEVPSARHKRPLTYVTEALWQVESELARDSRQALVDFNKLVLGAARYKLFVGPIVDDPEAFIDVLRPAAARCTGEVFAALIPHPRRWDDGEATPLVWRLQG